MIEVEKKALLTREQYEKNVPELLLQLDAPDLGERTTDTVFFVGKQGQTKIQPN